MNDFIEVLIDEKKQASAVLNEVRWGKKRLILLGI